MLANEYQLKRLKQMAQKYAEQAVEVENVAWLFGTERKDEEENKKKKV